VLKNVNHYSEEVINCNHRIHGQLLKTSVLVGVFVLMRCEIFVYPSTVTHEQLNVSYFAELV
jgi:hypothetical protein